MTGSLHLLNCKVLHPTDGTLQLSNVVIDITTGTIMSVLPIPSNGDSGTNKIEDKKEMLETMDCQNYILSPGFIDIQLNGCFGVDFSDPNLSKENVLKVAKSLPQTGVTSFCPTMVSSSKETYRRTISLLGSIRDDETNEGANILGMHVEGPFFAKAKRGAHSNDCIVEKLTKTSIVETYGATDVHKAGVSIVTLAPELDGALNVIKQLSEQGVVVAMGHYRHTNATLEESSKGVHYGSSLITHLFNAMNPFHHREPGIFGLLANDDCPYYSIIADGLHSNPTAVKLAYKANARRAILVTDAMSAMGLGDGKHCLGSMSINITGKKATLAGTDTLAGSVVSMDSCVQSYYKFCGCEKGESLRAATLHPSLLLPDAKNKGVIDVGYDADLVLLDDELNVICTWVQGKLVHRNKCLSTRKRKLVT